MQKLILLLVLMYPFMNSNAQVRSGGTGAPSKSSGGDLLAGFLIRNYEKYLIERDALCRSGNRTIQNKDLLQIYLKFSLLKTELSADQCEEIDKYFACVNDRHSQEMIKGLKLNPYVTQKLKDQYKIDEKQVKGILQFFSGLGKKAK